MEQGTAPFSFNSRQELGQKGGISAENRPKTTKNGLKYARFAGLKEE
jgi:hypothetical protein